MRKNVIALLILVTSIGLASCGNSNVSGNTGSNNDVGFDPTSTSVLKTRHYLALRQMLIVGFGLTSGSAAVTMLDQNRTIFENPALTYNSTLATNLIRIMTKACEEVADEQFFADGEISIDTAWKKITGKAADEGARELETELLSKTASEGDDVKKFTLCLGAGTSAEVAFSNYVSK